MTAWRLFVTGLIGGFLLPLVGKWFGSVRSRAAYEREFPQRSYYVMYLVFAIGIGVIASIAFSAIAYLSDRTFTWNGVFRGIGWMIGMLLALPIVARSPKRS